MKTTVHHGAHVKPVKPVKSEPRPWVIANLMWSLLVSYTRDLWKGRKDRP